MDLPLYIPVYKDNGIGNTLKSFISGLSISDNTKIINNYEGLLGNYSSVLDESLITDGSDRIMFDTWRFLILKSEEHIQQNLPNDASDQSGIHPSTETDLPIFSDHIKIDLYYDRLLINDTVFNRITSGINKIVWQQHIIEEVNKIKDTFIYPVLGISVRTWTAPHEKDVGRPYDVNTYKDAITRMIESERINSIFISYDNSEAYKDYEEFLSKTNIRVFTYEKVDNYNATQNSIIKMLLLSKCNYFVCSRLSTFSELVFWFSGCSQKVIPVH
jgi:hypothetical protein